MTTFVFAAATLTLVALMFLVLPLVRRQQRMGVAGFASLLLIPLAAGLFYAATGNLSGLDPAQRQRAIPENIAAMVAQLEQRLEQEPDNLQGWMMLGRSHIVLEQYDKAVKAYARALELAGEKNPDLLANYAEALLLSDEAGLSGQAGELFEQVLELDPDNPRGLWYGGLAAQARGEAELAIRRFERLRAADPPEVLLRLIDRRIAAIRAGQQATGSPPETGSAREAEAETTPPEAAAADAALQVTVRVVPALAGQAQGSLFVFARRAGEQGPPLAAERHNASELPLTLRLDAGDAMLQPQRWQLEQPLEIVARISRQGTARPQSGDLEGRARYSPEEGDRQIEVVIDSVIH